MLAQPVGVELELLALVAVPAIMALSWNFSVHWFALFSGTGQRLPEQRRNRPQRRVSSQFELANRKQAHEVNNHLHCVVMRWKCSCEECPPTDVRPDQVDTMGEAPDQWLCSGQCGQTHRRDEYEQIP
jgi:hypothetical protein